jgi:Spy/CpxP family protein refolding chaperone
VKSRLLLALCGGVLAASLAACSGGGGSQNSSGQAAGAPGAATQGQGGPGAYGASGGRGRFGQLLKDLDLSDDQKTKIRQIVADARKKSEGADPQTRRANMRAAFDEIETSVLTPAQRVKFDKERAAMRAKYQPASPSPAAQ